MKELVLIFSFISSLQMSVLADNVFTINQHSKLQPMTQAFSTGTQKTKSIPETHSVVIGGNKAELLLPQSTLYFYVQTNSNATWKIVEIKKYKKGNRHIPYEKLELFSGQGDYTITTTKKIIMH